MGFETPEEGCLANIKIQEGTKDAPMGNLLCIIVESKDEVARFCRLQASGGRRCCHPVDFLQERQAAEAGRARKAASSESDPAASRGLFRSVWRPLLRHPVRPQDRRRLDLKSVSSSGHGGRILAADLSSASPAPADGTPQQPASAIGGSGNSTKNTLSNMRMTIAKRLAESKSTILHYYSSSEINIDNVLQVREKLNTLLAKGAVGRRAHQALHQRFYHQGHHHHLIVVVVHLTGIEDVSSCKNQKKAANEVNSDVMKMTIWS
ncbi:unnamed protein product, partial [Mesorhabditis spiculigera]